MQYHRSAELPLLFYNMWTLGGTQLLPVTRYPLLRLRNSVEEATAPSDRMSSGGLLFLLSQREYSHSYAPQHRSLV